MAEPIIESIEEYGLSKKKKNSSKLFSKVGVVGCGCDGQYIARVCSSYGLEVIFIETTQSQRLFLPVFQCNDGIGVLIFYDAFP